MARGRILLQGSDKKVYSKTPGEPGVSGKAEDGLLRRGRGPRGRAARLEERDRLVQLVVVRRNHFTGLHLQELLVDVLRPRRRNEGVLLGRRRRGLLLRGRRGVGQVLRQVRLA